MKRKKEQMAATTSVTDARKLEAVACTVQVAALDSINAFAAYAEERLASVHCATTTVEARLQLLEHQLASIEGEAPAAAGPASAPAAETGDGGGGDRTGAADNTSSGAPTAADGGQAAEVVAIDGNGAAQDGESGGMKNREHPELVRFFKMTAMGVPVPAVQHKMTMEGFDPALILDPDGLYSET